MGDARHPTSHGAGCGCKISPKIAADLTIRRRSVLEKPGDIAGMLTKLQAGDILFIDEIHRTPKVIEEYLYSAMEDYKLDIIIDQGPGARSVSLQLEKFTLIGSTTRAGLLSAPLLDRFGIRFRLNYYNKDELVKIVKRSAGILNIKID